MKVGSLGDAFRFVMDRAGWSGNRLAREMGTSQPWVSLVLNGRRDPGMRRSALTPVDSVRAGLEAFAAELQGAIADLPAAE